jgi:hypothetical protein
MSLWPINFLQLVCTIYVSAFYGYLIYKNFFYFKILWVSCLDPDAARLDRIKVISLVLFYIALTLTIVSCSDTEQSTVTAHERKFFIGMMIVTAGTYIYPNVLCPTLMVGMAGFTVYRNIMNVHVVHFDDDIPLADRGTAKGHSTPALKYPGASPSAIASTPEQAPLTASAERAIVAVQAPMPSPSASFLDMVHRTLYNNNSGSSSHKFPYASEFSHKFPYASESDTSESDTSENCSHGEVEPIGNTRMFFVTLNNEAYYSPYMQEQLTRSGNINRLSFEDIINVLANRNNNMGDLKTILTKDLSSKIASLHFKDLTYDDIERLSEESNALWYAAWLDRWSEFAEQQEEFPT